MLYQTETKVNCDSMSELNPVRVYDRTYELKP
jgi:hypothetical protein